MKRSILKIIVVSVLISSCGSSGEKVETETQAVTTAEEVKDTDLCTYSYNNESTGVFWKAYKHTGKIAVNGRFETFDVAGATTSSSSNKLLEGLKMSIDVLSINSNDTLRDGKLRRSFFGNMLNTSMIFGEIIAINGTTGTLKMKMNDVEKEVPFDIEIAEGEVEIRTTIDILDFAANKAFESIGEDCAEKHTGGDGVKKFWSEVDIYIKTTLEIACKD